MLLNCPVSLGEVVDKLAILRVKEKNINDDGKLRHIQREVEHLEGVLCGVLNDALQAHFQELVQINGRLWKIEDDIREKERAQEFDADFIALARSVYRVNDERFAVKNLINHAFGSELKEVKSYQKFE